MKKITVLGSGGWGTALAILSNSCNHKTVIWGKFKEEIENLEKTRENPLLKGIKIDEDIELTYDNNDIKDSDVVIIATPSFAVEETADMLKDYVTDETIIVSVAKGFEKDTLQRFSQVIKGQLPNNPVVVLSGPSHAEEVARKIPTSIVSASDDINAAKEIQKLLSNDYFRIYTNTDVIGVEVGAALKNIIAVSAGIIKGMNLGDNTIAAIITRGINEISKLGVAMGADRLTFAGLSGIGDLVVTCTSVHSRNRSFGVLVGQGVPIEKAREEIGTVEGYYATASAKKLADKYNIEMPIVNECYKILYENMNAKDAINNLMMRDKKAEHF